MSSIFGRRNDDMTEGPLLGKLVRYAIPLGLTGLLQIAFHAADMAVIGRFGSPRSLAGVGAIGELSWLLVCLVIGVSTGSNVVAAQMFGARDQHGLRRTVHTSIAFALVSGFALFAIGQLLLPTALRLINVPDEVYPLSLRYLRICVCGLPISMVTNFAISILRGVGDSRRPLYFLLLSGVTNVLLNVLFVAGFGMDVGGVAAATVLSQLLSNFLCVRALINERSSARLILRNIRFYPAELKRILWIGIPSGVQSACYSLANNIIQSAVNTLSTAAIAGSTASVVLEMALHTWDGAIYQTVMTAVGQNYGARKYDRAVRSIIVCIALSMSTLALFGWLTVWNGESLLGIFNKDPEVIANGMARVRVNFTVYFLLGAMDAISGGLRGLGRSITPMVVTMFGACALRVLWVFTVFRAHPSLYALFPAFPISWFVISAVNGWILYLICRNLLSGGRESPFVKILR